MENTAAGDNANATEEASGSESGGNTTKPGGIMEFAAATGAIGHVIMSTGRKESYEPLPFPDTSLFEENTDPSALRIHVNLQSMKKIIFIPKTPIDVKITADRKHGPHFFHPYNYTITFKHGEYTWKVVRSYKEFKDAHKSLAKQVKMDIGQSCSDISKANIRPEWPIFPTEHDHLIPEQNIGERCNKLAEYLRRVLTYPPFRDNPVMTTLLGVSPLSFIIGLGTSFIEGFLNKRTGDNIYYGNFSQLKICCDNVKLIHIKRWFAVKETYVTYLNALKGYDLCFPMLVDMDFTYKKGVRAGALRSITIKNSQRSLVIKFKNEAQQLEWYENISKMVENEGKVFCTPQRFNSFAPVRKNQTCRWYVNAAAYMEAVLMGLSVAKEEIYITDWWLCPEIFLKRPSEDLQYRLDRVLLKKAKEGVKIYVLLFKEVELAIGLKSLRAKRILTEAGKNPNVKVLRHPEHTPAGVFLWSHHEKCVIIDQSVAFVGGVDLCFGRWDDDLHRLIDLGRRENECNLPNEPICNPANPAPNIIRQLEKMKLAKSGDDIELVNMAPALGQTPPMNAGDAMMVAALMGRFVQNVKAKKEANKAQLGADGVAAETEINNRTSTAASTDIATPSESLENIESLPSKSNDDIIPANDSGEEMPDLSANFESGKKKVRQKWDRLKFTVKRRNDRIARKIHIHGISDDDEESMDEEEYKHDIADMPVISYEGYYWIGKDYANSYVQDFKDVEEFGTDQFNREETPRMPWRDQALVMYGESARDLARHFIQRWNQCKREKVNKNNLYPYLLPKGYRDGIDYDFSWFKDSTYNCDIQVTRSMGEWSGGINNTEHSILNAYEHLIDLSEHYIYIENQFFVTTTDPQNDTEVKNGIGRALANRIKRAHSKKEKFRVYVVLPLLPGFDSQNAIQAVQYYNLRSINRGKFSIYEYLKKEGIEDPSEYITFHGMRTHAVLMNKLVNEIIYVHSKLMIVDDKYVVCGSANINDRSLLGNRDSELAAIISDNELITSKFNDVKVQVGKYAHSLRVKIFKLHLGVYFDNQDRVDVTDCTSDAFYKLFRDTSRRNSQTYDDVFKCIPSDNILTFNDLVTYPGRLNLKSSNPAQAKQIIDENIKGFIVDFPLNFLSQEKNFFPKLKTAEGLVPTQMWT